jgi:predicted dehydrogenase
MNLDPVRLGVIGVGALALRGLLPHLSQDDVHDRVRLAALCDPALDRADAAAAQIGVATTYASVEEIVADKAVDAVTIASPIPLHYEHARLALEAGKHVHVNKTMATTVAEATDLIDLARARNLRLVASPGERLRPQIAAARRLIEEGAIGEVVWAICGSGFGSYHEEEEPERLGANGAEAINPSWYFRKPGGGPLYDMTVYGLHQMTSILGPALRVTALSGTRIRERMFLGTPISVDADDNTIVCLDFGDALFAVAFGTAAGEISSQFGAGMYFGTKGVIEGVLLNGEPFDFPGQELTTDAPVTDWDAQTRTLAEVVGAHRHIPEAHVFADVMELINWIRDDVPSPVTAEHARHVIDIIESGYRSAKTAATQDLTTTFDLSPIAAPAPSRAAVSEP